MINDNVFNFFDSELNEYEKTVLYLAIAYNDSPIFRLDNENILLLSDFLKINYCHLKKALTADLKSFYKFQIGKDCVVELGCHDYTLFHMLIQLCFGYENLNKISDVTDYDHIEDNLQLFQNTLHFFEMINVQSSTYECFSNDNFSFNYILYDQPGASPYDYIEMIRLLLSSKDELQFDLDFYSIIFELLQHELNVRLNAFYLILSCQIIKHSKFFDKDIKDIAEEMYSNLLYILKNGRVIFASINTLYFDTNIPVEKRTKNDNTTRLQILYGYDNYDDYNLRLDFSHGPQAFTHFNNESPGKTKSFLFNHKEYENILEKYPKLQNCFICYGSQWALKERCNCELTPQQSKIYDEISSYQEHYKVFQSCYSEDAIENFLNVLSSFLPSNFKRSIDTSGIYVTDCFNYDRIMRKISELYIAYLSSWLTGKNESVEMLVRRISQMAFRYNLITAEEQNSINSFEDIHYIILNAKVKLFEK